NYTVQVKIRWYGTDTGAVTRSQDDAADGLAVASLDETEPDLPVGAPQFSITQKFIYMQTLTGYEGDPGSVLEVPKHVQAVDMGTENTLHEVDYIKIPDTVRYVNTKNYSEQPEGTQTAVKGITVKKGYIVDVDSTAYAATADGILTNADGSAYLGIPYDMTELTVPENVEKVTLPNATTLCPRMCGVCSSMYARTSSGAAPAGARGGRCRKAGAGGDHDKDQARAHRGARRYVEKSASVRAAVCGAARAADCLQQAVSAGGAHRSGGIGGADGAAHPQGCAAAAYFCAR
ncbi:MAG: hypothetical protein ACLSV6_10295, partial [Butyricicoccus sp.]